MLLSCSSKVSVYEYTNTANFEVLPRNTLDLNLGQGREGLNYDPPLPQNSQEVVTLSFFLLPLSKAASQPTLSYVYYGLRDKAWFEHFIQVTRSRQEPANRVSLS